MLGRRGANGNRLQIRAHWPVQLLSRRRGRTVKSPGRQPTIGLLRCKHHNRMVAEYQLLRELPDALQKSLPTMAEIEAELAGALTY